VHIDGDIAVQAICDVCANYKIESLMTFGGEPLLYPETVCRIHAAARDCGVPKRQLITNGFFSRDDRRVRTVAKLLTESGVNDILLSVDTFHQETIPLSAVRTFAAALKEYGAAVRLQPAWIVGAHGDNPYDRRTVQLLADLSDLGLPVGDGNIVFPAGNALKYLSQYFDLQNPTVNPYEEDPRDLRSVSILPDGGLLNGRLDCADALQILREYRI
ncbi:MAG: hypothetical protein IJC25_05195, partial [Clostridia bacterium]|nr:hypothetical protein [Clostridia bacterium]